MNFINCLKYFFYTIRFFGIFPFEIEKNHLLPTIRSRLTIFGIPGIFVGVLVYFYGFSAVPKIKGGRFRALLLKLAFLTICSVYLSIVVLANGTYKKQQIFYNNLLSIDDDLTKQFSIEINHKKIARQSLALIAASLIYYIATMLIVILYSHHIGNFVFIFAEEFQRFQSSLCFIAFNMCVNVIYMQLTIFNRQIQVYMKESDRNNAITIEFILYILSVHMKIKKNIEILNSIYCTPLTIICSYYFYRVTSQLFGIITFFSDDAPHYLRPYMVFYQFLPTCWNVWILIMISYNCQVTMIKLKECENTILRTEYYNDNIDGKYLIGHFCQRNMHNINIKFYIFWIFDLDMSFLYSMCSAAATYLLVITQIQQNINETSGVN